MKRRVPGYERGSKWRGQGNEELCQLRELIREKCPRGEFGYDVFDLDIVILDSYNEKGITHIHLIEKQIIGAKKKAPYVQRRMALIGEAFRLLDKYNKKITYHGWHIVHVPDNVDYTKWHNLLYDGNEVSIEQFLEIINHNPLEPLEGGYKVG